ncbi:MAG: transglycosylase domain-containing protein [Caldilineaceae bacterium]|nr:transglycosylase domain-containing protein [Caldilineaceae bacterium]
MKGLTRQLMLLLALALLITGCNRTSAPADASTALTVRDGADPMNAVETYLQQYQPGALPRLFQTTRLYDRKGELLAEVIGEGRRTWVSLDKISLHLIHATVATEDASFFVNSGIDPLRIARALLSNAQEGQIISGASTITMQLARNLFLGADQRYDQDFDRKLLEAGLAQELTNLYSKGELLEMYLNLLNYGNLAYGPEAAAQTYFGKSAADLTLAEASYLAGIPQQPANLDPYRNFDATRRRQRIVLDLMVRHGYLTTTEADATYAESLNVQDWRALAPNLAPHFVQYVIETLNQQFGPGYTERAGLNIQTTLDLSLQKLAQQVVARKVAEFREPYDLSNAALVALRPNSGEVMVMVGSADFADVAIAGQVNVARSRRQPGSAIKPILYAAALDENLISPATILWDTPVTYTLSAGQTYTPQNYDRAFHGPITARSALANSYNIPTVKLLEAVGVARMVTVARELGITTLNQDPAQYGLSLGLGSGEVTLLDLTTAFHTFASTGNYWPATPLLSLRDSQERPLYLAEATQPKRVIKPETAFLISDILSDNEARTPAFSAQSPLRISRPAAVKTGTTTDWRDNWTVGYTRALVVGVWAGNSDGHPMQATSGVTGAAPIWHDFMEMILSDPTLLAEIDAPREETEWQFAPPPSVVQLPDCPPGVTCRAGGEYFTASWVQTTGPAGVLADSVETVPSAPVYLQQGEQERLAGFCTMAAAVERPLLRLNTTVGFAQQRTLVPLTATPTLTPTQPLATMVAGGATLNPSQLQSLAWTIQQANSTILNWGPCDTLKETVQNAVAGQVLTADVRVLVDLEAALNPTVGTTAGAGSVDIATLSGALDVDTGLTAGRYVMVGGIQNDNSCPGNYIMGLILNSAGAPVAGVQIMLRDPWGNQSVAVSKSGGMDYGMFDFPIAAAPQELLITVVENGNPISATFAVPHRMGSAGDASCHHIVLQGG